MADLRFGQQEAATKEVGLVAASAPDRGRMALDSYGIRLVRRPAGLHRLHWLNDGPGAAFRGAPRS